MLPGLLSPVGFLGGGPASVTYATVVNSNSNLTEYTFSAASIGTASGSRYVVVAISTGQSAPVPSISSVTVGGGACSSLLDQANAGDNHRLALWITNAPIGSGTTADIVVTNSGGVAYCTIGVWAVYDLQSTLASDTLADTGTTLSGTITAAAEGVLIGAARGQSTTYSWSGVTENYEQANDGGETSGGCENTTSGGDTTVSATLGSANSDDVMIVVALR